MTTNLSRRAVLGGAAVLGWSAVTGGWVTRADATPVTAPAPQFEGSFTTAGDDLGGFRQDFGRLITATPRAVLVPGSVADVQKAVRFAKANRIPLAMNGQSGTGSHRESHSNYGQALTRGGLQIDSRGLSDILKISTGSALVQAGVSWADLVQATLAKGTVPAALTDYLRLTVGGTISVGGIGGSVHRRGLQCDTVRRIDIVTGAGDLVTATPTSNAALFYAALGGGGQVGIIVAAEIALEAAPTVIGLRQFFYDDLRVFLTDQQRILAYGKFEHLSGEVVRRADDKGWRWKIEIGIHNPASAPGHAAFLGTLRDNRVERSTVDLPFAEWTFRVDGFETALRDAGYWEEPKPWLSVFLPADQAYAVIKAATDELTPDDLGAGFSIISPFPRARSTCPLFALPRSEVVFLFDLLRFPHPGAADIDGMLQQNRRFYDKTVAAGGKRYLVGAVPGMTPSQWSKHFGPLYPALAAAKKIWDPAGILTPGQGFFA